MRNKTLCSPKLLTSPVLFLVFNRPDTTRQVFEAIRRAQPSQLFVAADGPGVNKAREAEKCVAVRRIVDEGIDWDCKVHRLYRSNNVGCKIAVSSAIDWFFEHVEEGIILEDDCLPNQSFFEFCQQLLQYYKNDARIMQICGSNRLGEWNPGEYSYFFSRYGPVWGWASWRRAWNHYDVNINLWPFIRKHRYHYFFCSTKKEARWREKLFNRLYDNKIDTWDFQWAFAKLVNSGLSIVPKVNLVRNIGFTPEATHTKNPTLGVAAAHDIEFPLKHPCFVLRDKGADSTYRSRVLPSFSSKFKLQIFKFSRSSRNSEASQTHNR
ncbi:MAG: glycosyltransferase family 2 protein [Planctomycetota bacterium]|jgi:hypothetical protein